VKSALLIGKNMQGGLFPMVTLVKAVKTIES
jgi:hypothetical protein